MSHRARKDHPRISSRKKLAFNLIVFSIPVLFFVILELSLTLFHYGPDLSLFKVEVVNGKEYYTFNPSVKNRYFSRLDFTPDPSPEHFLVSKPAGTFRIFCLGGSTTVGYPYWYNGAFPSFLRDRLKALLPDRSIEIINLGMTATNSFTVLDLSRDLMKYQPDMLIVYDGHNEFYGALGAASNERIASARWITLLYLRIVHLRTYQLMKSIILELSRVFGKSEIDRSSRATLMEQVARGENVPYGSALYSEALSNFKNNLDDLRELCRTHHIPLILGTQVSNLRDQPLFISHNGPGLPLQQKSQFQQFYKRGLSFQSSTMLDSAITVFRHAIAIDSLFADIHYRLAQCLAAEGRKVDAFHQFVLARDCDELRFRTDSRFNDLIRSMADRRTCFVADVENEFESLSQDSLIGKDLILEHLHPNARGNFLIAKEYTHVMKENGLLAPSEDWARRDTVRDDSLWANRHITYIDELMADRKIQYLTSGWPFRTQSLEVAPIPTTDTLNFIANEAVHDRIGWVTAHNLAAQYYMHRGDYFGTAREFETIVNQLPLDVNAYLELARIYYNQNSLTRADSVLFASLKVVQTSDVYRALGDICMKQLNINDAIQFYEEMSKLPQEPGIAPENACVLALAYLMVGRQNEAILLLEETVSRYPSYPPARGLLSKALQQSKGLK